MNPVSKVREIAQSLHSDEKIQSLLVTAIAHGLESHEIDDLYKAIKGEKRDQFPSWLKEGMCSCGRKKVKESDLLCKLCLID